MATGITRGKSNFFRPLFQDPSGPRMISSAVVGGGAGGGGIPNPAAIPKPNLPIGSGMSTSGFNDRRGAMSQYKTTSNPRTDGTMNVTDAINAGHTVQPWLPSSGVGPGTRGYQGSYGGGYGRYSGGYGGDNGFKTGRPSASNSAEYYANRDAAIGNPITMLKMNGPGRGGNLMQSMINEARGNAGGGGDVWSQTMSSDQPSAGSNVQGDISDADSSIINVGDGKKALFSKYGEGSSFKPRVIQPGVGDDFEAVEQVQAPSPAVNAAAGLASDVFGPKPMLPSSSTFGNDLRNFFRPAIVEPRTASRAGQFIESLARPFKKSAKLAGEQIDWVKNREAKKAADSAMKAVNTWNYLFKPRPVAP